MHVCHQSLCYLPALKRDCVNCEWFYPVDKSTHRIRTHYTSVVCLTYLYYFSSPLVKPIWSQSSFMNEKKRLNQQIIVTDSATCIPCEEKKKNNWNLIFSWSLPSVFFILLSRDVLSRTVYTCMSKGDFLIFIRHAELCLIVSIQI